MALKLKTRGNEPKKVMVYGMDKSGKSTFAYDYCRKNNLKEAVIDIDDTNYTDSPIADIDLTNDLKAYNNIKKAIDDIVEDGYDTIIIDGVSCLIELLTSKAKGLKAYKDRKDRFDSILRKLIKSNLNLVFVGQIDMEVIYTEEFQSNKPTIKVNSIVNEKYLTYIDKQGKYLNKTISSRGAKKSSSADSHKKDSVKEQQQVKPDSEKTATEKAIEDYDKRAKEESEIEVLFIAEDFEGIKDEDLAQEVITRTRTYLEYMSGESSDMEIRKIIRIHNEELNNLRETVPNLANVSWKLVDGDN